MNITINRKSLLQALKIAKPMIEHRSVLPLLTGILVEIANGMLRLRSTDLELHLTQQLPVQTLEPAAGAVLVPFAPLLIAVARSRGEVLSLTIDNDKALTVADLHDCQVTLPALAPLEDCPIFPVPEAAYSATLHAGVLAELLGEAVVAVSSASTRFAVNGINFTLTADQVGATATDGHRLAVAARPACCLTPWQGILPTPTAAVIKGIAAAEPVGISVAKDRIIFTWSGGELSIKPLEKQFPDYSGVIPRQHQQRALVPAKELVTALARAVAVQQRKGQPSASFAFEPGRLVVTAGNRGEAGMSSTVPCQFDGPPLTIGCNPAFMRDAVGVLPGETAEIWMSGPDAALRIFPENRGDYFFYVVMPTKLAEAPVKEEVSPEATVDVPAVPESVAAGDSQPAPV